MITEILRPIEQVHGNGHKSGESINSVPFIVGLEAEDAKRVDIVGGKAARLAKLASIPGIKVPESFVITTSLGNQILQDPKIQRGTGLLDALSGELLEVKPGGGKTGSLESEIRAEGRRVKDLIEAKGLSDSIKMKIAERYEDLRRKTSESSVAVRSSEVAQDSLGSSFTRELGGEQVANAALKRLALQFGERAVAYRNQARLNAVREALEENPGNINSALKKSESLSHTNAKLAVVVQEMVFARGGFGLSVGHNGSSFVRLNVGFDSWDVDTSRTIKGRTLFNGHGREDLLLSDEEVVKIANDIFAIRKAFGREVHVEFMPHKGNILFVQAKPV